MNRKGEQIVDRIIGYLTLSVILLLCGLIFRDEKGFRGFPFGWYHQPGMVRFEWLIVSFAALLGVTVCAAVISAVIGGIREPDMKEPKKMIPEKKTVSRKISATSHKQHEIKIDTRKAADVIETIAGEKNTEKNPAIIVLSVIFVVFLLFVTLFADDNSNYDDYSYDDTYDYDVSDYEDVISSTAYDALDQISQGNYDIIYDLGAKDQAEFFEGLNISYIESFGVPYESEDDDGSVMSAYSYILYEDGWGEDSDADIYLVGVLVEYSSDPDQTDNVKVAGLSIYRFKTYDEYLTYYENGDDNTNSGLKWITPAECYNAGVTEMDGTFILSLFL